MFYSASKRGFYTTEMHGDDIPDDAVEIDEKRHLELLDGQNNGQVIVSNENGEPILVDAVPDRSAEIRGRLSVIDAASVRAIRAMLSGGGSEADELSLKALDDEAAALRDELKRL